MNTDDRIKYQVKLSEAFRPGAPIDSKALFSGRWEQVDSMLNAVFQPGQHVVMFGERGVGKTSLCKTFADILQGAGVTALSSGTINCDGTDDFSKLWHKIFRELQVVIRTEAAGFSRSYQETTTGLEGLLPERVTPDDVRFAIVQAINLAAQKKRMIIILDEVDRIQEKAVTTLLSDTIKNLSDHLVPVTIVLVGVADAVDKLIAGHQSIERSLVQIPMPRMSTRELNEVITKGFTSAGIAITEEATNRIIALSQGLPHFTHLLSLESGLSVLSADRIEITEADVINSTKNAVSRSHSLLSAYHKATNSTHKNNLYGEVLLACAMAPKDALGWFTAADIVEPMSQIRQRACSVPYFARHLAEFTAEKRGPLLQKYDSARQHKYRFVNPLIEPFTMIHAISIGALGTSPAPA